MPMRQDALRHIRLKGSRGVLLIDTLVSVALFAVIIVVVVGALTMLVDTNRKTRGTRTVIDNVNLAIESMGRTIRSGTTYHCGSAPTPDQYAVEQDCPSGQASVFAVEKAGGIFADPQDQVVFRLNATEHSIERSEDSGQTWQRLTGPDARVEDLDFKTVSFGDAGEQPKVLITVDIRAGADPATETQLTIQTTVTQRLRLVSSQQSISEGSSNPQNPICPFEAAPGRYFINFEVGKTTFAVLRADGSTCVNNGTRNRTGPYTPQAPIPPGTYRVTLVAYDIHCDDWPTCAPANLHATQIYERIRLQTPEWTSAAAGCDPSSGCTADIPDAQQLMVTVVGDNVEIENTISGNVYTHHGYYCYGTGAGSQPTSGAHSVVPACAIFDELGGGINQQSIDIEEF